jgi:hypothetical protein
MKLSHLVEELQAKIRRYGDIEVVLESSVTIQIGTPEITDKKYETITVRRDLSWKRFSWSEDYKGVRTFIIKV